MLNQYLKPLSFGKWDQETWEDYVKRVNVPEERAIREFYRQVIFDHWEHHNDHYPAFEVSDYNYEIVALTVMEVRANVNFFPGEKLEDMWGGQYEWFEEENREYIIYQSMSKNKTPPFPPVIIDTSNLVDDEWRVYGRPLHLIEGTHRVSYLIHMAKRGLVSWDSTHEFVQLSPKSISNRAS